jgi:hypothetical protein
MSSRALLAALPVASAALLSVVGTLACSPAAVTVEVLPPRTSVTCSAPTEDDPALGRGLLDAKASESVHGGYLADLRLVSTGADASVDGVDVTLERDGDEIAKVEDVPTGDVQLVGEDDDIRRAVVENVEIVGRDTAKDLAADTKITDVDFATLVATITPRVTGDGVEARSSTFALDVCNGCLVGPPSEDVCPNGSTATTVCREGQDVKSFACLPAQAGGTP